MSITARIFHNVHSPPYHPQSHTIYKEKARLTSLQERIDRKGVGGEREIKNGPN